MGVGDNLKELSKQDRNGTRTSQDIERKYNFKDMQKKVEKVENSMNSMTNVDEALSLISTNPVQNKIVTQELNKKVDNEEGKGLSENNLTDELLETITSAINNMFSGNYEDLSNKPTIPSIDGLATTEELNEKMTNVYTKEEIDKMFENLGKEETS